MLVPGEGTSLRGALNGWLLKHQLQPRIIGEFDDMALLKAFGQAGMGVLPIPAVIADEVMHQYDLDIVGYAEDAMVTYYAISHERRLKHPAVVAVSQAAKRSLFSETGQTKNSDG
jgi:LysR family transcriptional activator of nhaA